MSKKPTVRQQEFVDHVPASNVGMDKLIEGWWEQCVEVARELSPEFAEKVKAAPTFDAAKTILRQADEAGVAKAYNRYFNNTYRHHIRRFFRRFRRAKPSP